MQLSIFDQPRSLRLSKSRFVAGVQCPRLLRCKVHEPDAAEFQPDKVLQDGFDQGIHVGEVARPRFPEGVLIDLPHTGPAGRLAAAQAALENGSPVIFEVGFQDLRQLEDMS